MGSKISSASTYVSSIRSNYHNIINLNSFNSELSSIDIALLSRLMKISIITYQKTKLDDIITMKWKNHQVTCIKGYRSSPYYSEMNDRQFKRIIDDDITIYNHFLNMNYPMYIRDNAITVIGYRSQCNVVNLEKRDIESTWYSGTMILHGSNKPVDYIIIDDEVIEFIHYYGKVILINMDHQYNLETRTSPTDDCMNFNVRLALGYILDEYYS